MQEELGARSTDQSPSLMYLYIMTHEKPRFMQSSNICGYVMLQACKSLFQILTLGWRFD